MKRPKRLYKIWIQFPLMVLGEDEREAKEVALDCAQLELEDNLDIVCEVRSLNGGAPAQWLDRVPYGHHLSRALQGKTVREFLLHRLFEPYNKEK